MPGRSPELRALQKPQKEDSVEEKLGASWPFLGTAPFQGDLTCTLG